MVLLVVNLTRATTHRLSFKQREQMTSIFHLRWKCYLRITQKMAHFVGAVSSYQDLLELVDLPTFEC